MTITIRLALADDTSATHCGSCHHGVSGAHRDDECRAFEWPGEPLVWDEAAASSVRSERCHEATLPAPSLALVLGSAAVTAARPLRVVSAPFVDEDTPPDTQPAPAIVGASSR